MTIAMVMSANLLAAVILSASGAQQCFLDRTANYISITLLGLLNIESCASMVCIHFGNGCKPCQANFAYGAVSLYHIVT